MARIVELARYMAQARGLLGGCIEMMAGVAPFELCGPLSEQLLIRS